MSEFIRAKRDVYRFFAATGAAAALFAGGLAFGDHNAAESLANSGEPALAKEYNKQSATSAIVAGFGLLSALGCALTSAQLTSEMQPRVEPPTELNDITEA